MTQNILIIGIGGREHALAWKLHQSPRVRKLYVAPGNGGTQHIAENVPLQATDITGLLAFAQKNAIDLTLVGPDDPLALGIVDAFQAQGLRIFGPTSAAARIESSKAFSKQIMQKAGVPTASFATFSEYTKALAYIQERGAPIVVKASGLALGKGVYVCATPLEAQQALREIMLDGVHKEAGNEVVIEEYLAGREISVHAFCDGKHAVLFPSAQDHKRAYDGDNGPNTGGMGTIAPVPWVTPALLEEAKAHVVEPTLKALAEEECAFSGLLYPGLMIAPDGIKTLEFNARFGDPETQSYMRLLATDLLDCIDACVDGTLATLQVKWCSEFAACVVLASGGYPGAYQKGVPIYGVEKAEELPGVVVFHAGTQMVDGVLVTAGGRVLGVTAVADTLQNALDRAYEAVDCITFEGKQYRKDIGKKTLSDMT